MIIWINGAFGSGKTSLAYALNKKIEKSFVFDPEMAGVYIRHNLPKDLIKNDFQDHGPWRSINKEMLRYIRSMYDGVIIVPMTITNDVYFEELVMTLKEELPLYHFTLMASDRTLKSRLLKRGEEKDAWPFQQIERCQQAFKSDLYDKKIHTDMIETEEIVDIIIETIELGEAK